MRYADSLFEKVIFTILENSIRHGLKVTDVWFSYQIQNSGLLLIYEDNGIGIGKGNKTRIFEKNFGKNTGLGLFLVLEILSITGISIRENGKEGEGVRFEISIPDGIWKN
jgi:signal transduction histidine kinase